MQHDVDLTQGINALRDRFVDRTATWLPAFDALREDLNAGKSVSDISPDLLTQAHQISGTAGTFGFSTLTGAAAELHDHLEKAINGPAQDASSALDDALETFLNAVEDLLHRPSDAATGFTAEPVPGMEDTGATARAAPQDRSARIMIIEDDELLRQMLTDGLARKNWEFTVAVNGLEAILTLFRLSGAPREDRPDLILLDVDMPVMDGLEALKLIQSSPAWHTTPVVMLTARDEDIDVIRGISGGAQEYVTKPFDLRALSAKIDDMLAANRARIMIASSDPIIRDTLRDRFSELGYFVVVAKDGIEAENLIRDGRATFAVMDSELSKRRGEAVFREMISDGSIPSIPTVMLEAEGNRSAMLSNLLGGVHDSVMKPFDAAEVVARAQRILSNPG